jgi:hypothetical protein
MTKEALKLALDALEADPAEMVEDENGHMVFRRIQAIITLREALANEALDKMAENARELGLDYEPEQPKVRTGNCLRVGVCASEGHKIQPQRTWVGLTDEEIRLQWSEFWEAECHPWAIDFAQAIEAKLRSKNNG